jgi:hypothetical protein
MIYDLFPGDAIHIGDAVTLTVVAVEGDLIHFGLESPEDTRPDARPNCQRDNPSQDWWELN